MIKTIEVPKEYGRVLGRALYENKMSTINLAALVERHINDETAEFVLSDVYQREFANAVHNSIEAKNTIDGIMYILKEQDEGLKDKKTFEYCYESFEVMYQNCFYYRFLY